VRFGLRARVALVFAVLSMVVAMLVSTSIYLVSQTYLTNQRQSAGLTRALLDARSADGAIAAGEKPGAALNFLPVVGGSQALIRVDGEWYSRGTTLPPSELPETLIRTAVLTGGAQQRFAVSDQSFYAVAVDSEAGLYVELFPLSDLLETLQRARVFLLLLTLAAFFVGGAIGRAVGGWLMRPLERLASGARQLAAGDLSVRLPQTDDPDLDPISDSFNEMAVAVASRIERERRFVANVSHELRSPMTTVVATAELLEEHREGFEPREARLVTNLAGQTRRLARILLDLLEISSVTATVPVQREATDIAALVEAVLAARELDVSSLVVGDRPIVVTDARRVERVLANLVDNATRHGDGVRQVLIAEGGGRLRIHVDDAGPGVAADDVERLFEPFARGERAESRRVEGAGLGLAIVREQAEAIGGVVRVDVSPFGGARFSLVLQSEAVS
jgi:signal transduction histidine kinase